MSGGMTLSNGGAQHRGVLFIICGTIVLILLVGFPILRALHRSQLHALFSGPSDEKAEQRSGFYPRVPYDLTGYLAEEQTKPPTEPDRDQRPSILDKREDESTDSTDAAHLEATSIETRIKRLTLPSVYKARWVPRSLTITYPPQDAVFPPNLCSPFVEWRDLYNDLWQLTLSVPDASLEWTFLISKRRWRIPDDVWEQVKKHAGGGRACVLVKGIKRRGWWGRARESVHRSQVVDFHISKDPADNAIVHQLIDPPFLHGKTPRLLARDIRKKEGQVLLNTRQLYCANCHTWSSKRADSGKVALQVRYRGREPQKYYSYLVIYDIDKQSGRKIILPFDITLSTFTAWSPDRTKLAISARQVFPATPGPSVFETQNLGEDSDIAVYDASDETGFLLSGASDAKTIETHPRWTPDGRSIVYASAPSGRHPTETRFELNVIPYNQGRGGKPSPLPGASQRGKSNYFPRFSPDGKWFTFVRSNWSTLIKASSDIYIMPADFKTEPRPLECNMPYTADSWHSWSSNSRWIVFATKRDDGIFARLYMTHIDDEGQASPAVRVPLLNSRVRMSFNVPEFLADVPSVSERRLFDGISVDADVFNVKPFTAEAYEPEVR